MPFRATNPSPEGVASKGLGFWEKGSREEEKLLHPALPQILIEELAGQARALHLSNVAA